MGGGLTRGLRADSEVWHDMHPLVSAAKTKAGKTQHAYASARDKRMNDPLMNRPGKSFGIFGHIDLFPPCLLGVPGMPVGLLPSFHIPPWGINSLFLPLCQATCQGLVIMDVQPLRQAALLIRQGRFFRLGVPNSLPSLLMDVSMLKFDFCQSYCLAGSPSGNHQPRAALTTRG